jgi:hypothetical protein
MEAPYIGDNRSIARTKVLAIIILAVVGTFAASYLVFHQPSRTVMADVNPAALHDLYTHWKAKYGYQYGGPEDKYRFKVFSKNYDLILTHNNRSDVDYKLGLNQFAGMTQEEYAAIYLGYHSHKKPDMENRNIEILPTDNLPTSIDWEDKGGVTPVKNQGQCGSCWAFSTTGALEGLNFVKSGSLLSFSEQQLVDCSGSYGNMGCNGGLMDNGFKYVEDNGIELEDKYPYKGVDGKCQYSKSCMRFQNKGYKDVQANSVAQLQAALQNGPVSVAVEADQQAFQFYSSGVVTGNCGTQLDHGVLVVGYGDLNGKQYWKVKNSWGPSWGNKGYIYILRKDGEGVCGIQMQPSYPTA